jgi:hypothetical protein
VVGILKQNILAFALLFGTHFFGKLFYDAAKRTMNE